MRKIEKTPADSFRELDLNRGKLVKEMLQNDLMERFRSVSVALREELNAPPLPSDPTYLAKQGLQGDIGQGYSIEIPGRLDVDEGGNIQDVKATKIPWQVTRLRDMNK